MGRSEVAPPGPPGGPHAPEQAAAERMGDAPMALASLAEETLQARRLLTHIEAWVDGTAEELEALERRRLELRGQPVAEETLSELEALLARVVEYRSRLLRLHVSASLGKAAIGCRIDELERGLSPSSASAAGGRPRVRTPARHVARQGTRIERRDDGASDPPA